MKTGLVKSLHPAVHAGLLAHKYTKSDDEFMKKQGLKYIDALIVNFYALDEMMKAFTIVDTPTDIERNSLETLRTFNLLRIALLHQQMNHTTEELKAWQILENSWSTDDKTITLAQLFQKGKINTF